MCPNCSMKKLASLVFIPFFVYGLSVDEHPINCLPFDESGKINHNCQTIKALPFDEYSALNEHIYAKHLKKGWNLVNLPSNFNLDSQDAKVIYQYDSSNNSWKYYSKNITLNTMTKITTLDNTKGYWVLANNDFKITYPALSINPIDFQALASGWHLFGTFGAISDFGQFGANAKLIWTYADGTWRVKGLDEKYQKLVANSSYEVIKYIPMKSGYWLMLKQNISPISNFSITPAKTNYYLNEIITLNTTSTDADDDSMTYLWSIDNKSEKSITTSFSTTGTKTIDLTTTDANNASHKISKTITVLDQIKEPGLSTLLATPKVYSYTDSDGIKTTHTVTKYGTNSMKLVNENKVAAAGWVPDVSATYDYIMNWTGKGYEGTFTKSNYVAYQGKYNSTYNISITTGKEKNYIFLDCINKQVKRKNYHLYKMTISAGSQSETRYFSSTNLDSDTEITLANYNTLLTGFDTKFNSLEIVVDVDTPANVLSQMFEDVGF